MKKKSFLIIAVLCLALLFTATVVACTGDDNTDETPGNTDVTPGGDDVTPGGDDVTPGGDDVTPGGDQPEEIFYTVTFDTQGGSEMPSVYIKAGTAIGAITDPLKQCQTFVGFSLNPGGGTFWNTETDPVTDNITLYAVWAAAHTWGEWQTVTAATCTDEGSQQRMCFVCGEDETQAISALGHNYAIIASDDTYHWKECCRCNSVSEKESHVYIDGLCECGEIETTTDSEFTFTELGKNQWSIAKYNGNRAYVKIPSMHNGGTVVAIGDEAFGGDTTINLKLKSVVIPDSVTTIGEGAFSGCIGLTSITIGEYVTAIGEYAFYSCMGLTSVEIPDSVKAIGDSAFYGCHKLIEVYNKSDLNITAGSEDNGYVGFYAKNVYTDEGGSKLSYTDDGYIFYYDGTDAYLMGYCGDEINYILPDSFTAYNGEEITSYKIHMAAFAYNMKITSAVISDSVTTIGDSAFYGCMALQTVEIPDSVTTIGEGAFVMCIGLTLVTIGESVTTIGDSAFNGCHKLIEVYNKSNLNITAGSEDNGYVGFYAKNVYTEEEGESKLTYTDGYIFYYDGTDGYLLGYCGDETELTLPDSFTAYDGTTVSSYGIYQYAFSKYVFPNYDLTSVDISDSVTTIGDSAFADCTGLTSVYYTGDIAGWCGITFEGYSSNPLSNGGNLYIDNQLVTGLVIPDTVTEIKAYAFQNCASLTSVTIGESVTTIGGYAFSGCDNLQQINWEAVAVNDFDYYDSVFYNSGTANCMTVTFSDRVQRIPSYAFQNCASLTSVTIGESVTTIGGYAFSGCDNLQQINWDAVAVNDFDYYDNVFYNSGTANGMTVTFSDRVQRIPSHAFDNCASLTSVTIGDSVSVIESWAFYDCPMLTSVEIPDSVTTIEEYAFGSCPGLTSVVIPDSVTTIKEYAFGYCTGLTSVTIGESVTTIGDYAFNGCYKLIEVYNKSKFEITAGSWDNGYVGYYAKNVYTDEGGSKLSYTDDGYIFYYDGTDGYLIGYNGDDTELTLPDSFTAYDGTQVNSYEIYQYAFYGCIGLTSVLIPDSVTTIGNDAFYGCSGLMTVTIGESVTTIGGYAFAYCSNLQQINWDAVAVNDFDYHDVVFYNSGTANGMTVTFSDRVQRIPSYAFDNCASLTSVTIGDSVTTIGDSAFSDCDSLTSVTIGKSVTTIGYSAFYGCTGLISVTIPDSVITIGDSAFGYCAGLTSVTIGESVTTIGYFAFDNCASLTSVYYTGDIAGWCGITFEGYSSNPLSNGGNLYIDNQLVTGLVIPDTVTEIKAYAFQNCASLTSVTIGESVTTIGGYAFYGCIGLTSLTIPDSVTSIGSAAFQDCVELTSVTIGESVTTIGGYAFYGCIGLTSLTIPDSVTSIGSAAFRYCVELTSVLIPDSVTTIGDYAFADCTGLTSVTIGDSVTTIGDSAFDGCTQAIKIENGVGYVDKWAVDFDNSVTEVTLRNDTVGVADSAFFGYYRLTTVVIPDSVKAIGDSAFYGCHKLIEVYNKSDLNITAGSEDNGYVGFYAKNVYTDEGGSKLSYTDDGYIFYYDGTDAYLMGYYGDETELTLPDSFTAYDGSELNSYKIYQNAFYYCDELTSVAISDSVTAIGDSAFYGCAGLISVTIPDSVTAIGDSAFQNCIGLTSVLIPDSVMTIGGNAFAHCYGLTAVTLEDTEGWQVSLNESFDEYTPLPAESLADPAMVAQYLIEYSNYLYYIRKV